MMGICIRKEEPCDYRTVEELTRKAFWNVNVPGCTEHYLLHTMRAHRDFIPDLDLVIELDGQIIGNIVYTRSELTGEDLRKLNIVTFGPVSILPEYQRRGYGSMLINHSIQEAIRIGHSAIVIYGNPGNYVKFGFKSCKRFKISDCQGEYPCAMLVKELKAGILSDRKWTFKESEIYNVDEQKAEQFDSSFEVMKKGFRDSQEEFYILFNSRIVKNFL